MPHKKSSFNNLVRLESSMPAVLPGFVGDQEADTTKEDDSSRTQTYESGSGESEKSMGKCAYVYSVAFDANSNYRVMNSTNSASAEVAATLFSDITTTPGMSVSLKEIISDDGLLGQFPENHATAVLENSVVVTSIEAAKEALVDLLLEDEIAFASDSHEFSQVVQANPQLQTAKRVYAYSIDHDGCGECDELMNIVIKDIVDRLKSESNAMVVLLVGSFRQSIDDDIYNMGRNKNDSCYDRMMMLRFVLRRRYESLKDRILLCPILLLDIAHDKPLGYFFKKAARLISAGQYAADDEDKLNMSWHDENKIAMHYVHLNYLAGRFKDKEIFYRHYDDRRDILENLGRHFSRKLDIPFGVEYQLVLWIQGRVENYLEESIIGRGCIDFDYQTTVKEEESATARTKGLEFNAVVKVHNWFKTIDILKNKEGLERIFHVISGAMDAPEVCVKRNECYAYLLYLALLDDNEAIVKSWLDKKVDRSVFQFLHKIDGAILQKFFCDKYIHLLVPFLQVCFTDEQWKMLESLDQHPRLEKLLPVISQCIEMRLYQDVCHLIAAHRDFRSSDKKIATELLSHLNSNRLLRDKNVEVVKLLIQAFAENKWCSNDLLQLLTSINAKKSRGVDISGNALRAVRYILHIEKVGLDKIPLRSEVVIVKLLFSYLLPMQYIQGDQFLDKRIHEYYKDYVAYQAFVCGKAEEELENQVGAISSYASAHLSQAELEIINVDRVVRELSLGIVNTAWQTSPLYVLLTALRAQADQGQNSGRDCRVAFFALQSVLIANRAQCSYFDSVTAMKKEWLGAINFNEMSSSKTNHQVLGEADSQLGCWSCLWNSINGDFVETFPVEIIGVTGVVNNYGFLH